MNNELWLFDYNQAKSYENFSKCEDFDNKIKEYLKKEYNFSSKVVLEIGSGSGKFTGFLADNSKKVYAVEIIDSLMKINKRKNQKKENVEFLLSNAKEISLRDKSIDYVFAGWSLTSMRNIFEELFKQINRLLKPDGKIIIIENGGNDEFCKLLNIEKFTNQMINEYYKMGLRKKIILNTIIKFDKHKTFYNAFPAYNNIKLKSLKLNHNVIIMEKQNTEGVINENSRI